MRQAMKPKTPNRNSSLIGKRLGQNKITKLRGRRMWRATSGKRRRGAVRNETKEGEQTGEGARCGQCQRCGSPHALLPRVQKQTDRRPQVGESRESYRSKVHTVRCEK